MPAADLSAANQNWVGVYRPGQTPGVESSTEWQYAPGASGTLTFSSGALPGVGKYVAYLFYDNGYTELAGPLNLSVTPSKPAPAPRFERSLGQGHLADPFGLAVAPDASLWVADRGTSLIDHFSQSGKFLGSAGAGRLRQPDGVAVDSAGDVWVADTGHDQVVEFSPAGKVLRSFGSPGSGNGQLDKPQGLAVDAAGHAWVADQDNNRAEEFSAAGRYLSQISVATPWAIAIDPAGNLWMSSPSYADGNAVWELRPGSASNPVAYYGSVQASYGAFSNTAGVALGAQGRIYVAQPDYNFVTVLNSDGSFYTEFGLRKDPAGASENLSFPYGIAVTGNGTVYVADSGNGRIVEYSPAGHPSAAASTGAATTGVPARDARACHPGRCRTAAHDRNERRRAGRAGQRQQRSRQRQPPVQARPPGQPPLAAVGGHRADGRGGRRQCAAGQPAQGHGRVAAQPPAGGISDIEHIVILMQENRSFDHYFGTMPGVRGFADPAAITLSTRNPVFYQPDSAHAQGYLLPFHYDTRATSAQATPGTDHSWPTQHQAWNNGKMDQWIPAKGEYTMGYFMKDDIPFHWALAEAFTICDNYHCSVLGPTNPNRLHMWTGMIDPDGTGGGPIIDNSPAFNNVIL